MNDLAHSQAILTDIATVIVVAVLFGLGLMRAKQPPLVGFILAGVLMEPARVGAMFRDTTRGSSRASASSAASRPLASCAADDVLGAHHPAARTDADGPNSDGLGRGMTVLDAVSCRSSLTDRTRHET